MRGNETNPYLNSPQNAKNRLQQLDSLRGLAALSVLFGHFLGPFPELPNWFASVQNSPLHIFWAGHQAVVFFFVLSGFVLSLPYLDSASPPPYSAYVIKRILRIYPPYVCAAGIAMFFREWLYAGSISAVSDWFNSSWIYPVTWSVVKDHLIMLGSFRNNDFDPVLWSLVLEMRISLIFPALALLVCWRERVSALVAIILTSACLGLFFLKDAKIIGEPPMLRTLEYIGPFIIGALLAKNRKNLVSTFEILSRPAKWVWIAFGVLLYTYVFWFPPLISTMNERVGVICGQQMLGEIVTTLGVCIFILASLSAKKLTALLEAKPLKFLGSISYSLYLYHFICLKVAVTLLNAVMPLWVVLCIALVSSFVVSTLGYYLVEIPSINLGKWASKVGRSPISRLELH